MPTAIWNNQVIAEASESEAVVVEGNIYFPRHCVQQTYLRRTGKETVCGWKGVANYFDVVVGDQVNPNAAWTYEHPKDAARQISSFVAFWKGVTVVA
ncbi:DUF427 domain-containing protein [Undibacterium sp. Jales W-56]|uniref:DUF427 domain-containing protein n=1 Tax=Undibacterium sp. Jales W-56 TaxID=2897325 RepID=UPI0021D2E870|nr:DUF427 domain-containing protein [Undibacterium sp. Jales W-56]MCU6434848.1 DUF427 domain-containing protein [Undibacterium sp. Jales W-56]